MLRIVGKKAGSVATSAQKVLAARSSSGSSLRSLSSSNMDLDDWSKPPPSSNVVAGAAVSSHVCANAGSSASSTAIGEPQNAPYRRKLEPLLKDILQDASWSEEDIELWRSFPWTKKVEVLSLDIDGTLANIEARIDHARGKFKDGSRAYWDELLRGDLYHMDSPIPEALACVKQWLAAKPLDSWRDAAKTFRTANAAVLEQARGTISADNQEEANAAADATKGKKKGKSHKGGKCKDGPVFVGKEPPAPRLVVYVSGRRDGTQHQTKEWLDKHGFPPGRIFHRCTGVNSYRWKANMLWDLRKVCYLRAHVGDRDDDRQAAEQVNVLGVQVNPNTWLTAAEIEYWKYGDVVLVASDQ